MDIVLGMYIYGIYLKRITAIQILVIGQFTIIYHILSVQNGRVM